MAIGPEDFERKVDELWSIDEGQPCPACKGHLLKFALARPRDFEFLTAADMVDRTSLVSRASLSGIPFLTISRCARRVRPK